ncbi:MAG: hypothetical protein CL878_15410 [Dehalococcoidia bacterium]|nr:hypothetical protein [Dehalococcoidia bacterium]
MLSEFERSHWLHTAYYEVLNEDPDDAGFPAALAELAASLIQHWDTQLDESMLMDRLPPELYGRLWEFAQRWHLPRGEGRRDVFKSVWNASGREVPGAQGSPRLVNYGMTLFLPVTITQEEQATRDRQTRPRDYHFPRIWPIQPLDFHYDPSVYGVHSVRQWAKQLCQELEADIVRQAEAIEAIAEYHGFARTPSRHVRSSEMRRMALRLYRALVCGWDNDRILGVEARDNVDDPTYQPPSPQAVSNSVTRWAKRLDLAS